eukprot:scaffold37342_cov88-Skeletonema_marinoi.AAC.1
MLADPIRLRRHGVWGRYLFNPATTHTLYAAAPRRWKDTVWKEGKMSAYAHRNGGKFKDYDLREDLTE